MTTASRLARLAAAAATGAALCLAPAAAQAEPAPARVMPANETSDCLDQGKVWLVVQDSKDQLLVNKCVEVAANGEKLLSDAGVKATKDAKGQMICTIEGEPATCPAKFDGNYWHYYTASKGGKWTFSQVGANQSKPKPGSLEGWCYGKECTPAMPAMGPAGDATATPSAAASSAEASPSAEAASEKDGRSGSGPLLTIAVLAALAGLLGVFLAKRRKA